MNGFDHFYWPTSTAPFLVFADSPGARAPTFKHPTRSSAETEARRLSALTPGVNFYVLGSLSITNAPKPVKVAPQTHSLV